MFKWLYVVVVSVFLVCSAFADDVKDIVPFLYRVEKDGYVGLILGSCHAGVCASNLPPYLLYAVDHADSVTFEIDEPSKAQTFFAFLRATVRLRGPKLSEQLSEKAWSGLLRATKMNPFLFDRLTPFGANLALIAGQVKTLAPGLVKEDMTSMDTYLLRRARAAGARIQALETVDFQIEVMKQTYNAAALEKIFAPGEEPEGTEGEKQVKSEQANLLSEFRLGKMETLETSARLTQVHNAEEWKSMYLGRNVSWAPKLAEAFSRPGLNMAVIGALHLPTEDGVLHQLERMGFKVTRVEPSSPAFTQTFPDPRALEVQPDLTPYRKVEIDKGEVRLVLRIQANGEVRMEPHVSGEIKNQLKGYLPGPEFIELGKGVRAEAIFESSGRYFIVARKDKGRDSFLMEIFFSLTGKNPFLKAKRIYRSTGVAGVATAASILAGAIFTSDATTAAAVAGLMGTAGLGAWSHRHRAIRVDQSEPFKSWKLLTDADGKIVGLEIKDCEIELQSPVP